MSNIKSSSRKIDTVFIAALFLVFALTTFFVVLLAAKQFKHTAKSMEYNYEVRTATSYLREAIHQHDVVDSVEVTTFCDFPAIGFHEMIGEVEYTSYIYYFDGKIREVFLSADSVVGPEAGNSIISASGLEFTRVNEHLVSLTYTDTTGVPHQMYVTLRSGNRKASL